MPYLRCRCPEFKNCPFRTHDLELEIIICNFLKATTGVQSSRLHNFTSRACEWTKTEEGRLASIRKISHKKTLDFLKNAQVGDTVYCRVELPHEVKLLKKPLDLNVSRRCKCQKTNGRVISVHVSHLSIISKGSYYGEYFFLPITRGKKEALELKNKSMYYGFRAELLEKNNGYLLKLYGDSQQEVDDFINLFIKQKFELIF